MRIGISTCPNDTFAFHAIMHGLVDCRGIDFQIELLDIQQLNDRLFAGDFEIAKCSFHAALLLTDSTVVMPSGSALGFGVGPLLLSSAKGCKPTDQSQRTLCPGEHTTANLLFRIFYPETTRVDQVVFSEIMPQLQSGSADFGVCIHEGRFTWQQQGLHLVEDLGVRWESETQCPLPLGGLVARRSVDPSLLKEAQAVIRESIEYSLAQPEIALPTMRKHAQEFNDQVLMDHVTLYVNDWTLDLGTTGKAALERLGQKAAEIGIGHGSRHPIEVFGG